MLSPPPLPRTLEAALRDVESQKPAVRASAIEDLVRHARGEDAVREKALPILVKRLHDEVGGVRGAAAVGLGDLKATEHVDELLRAVDDDDGHVRQMALNALGEIGDDRALPRLQKGLKDARPEVRYQSVIAIARAGAPSDVVDQAVLDATADDDDAVVHIALRVAEERIDDGHPLAERLAIRARSLAKTGAPAVRLVASILLAKAGDQAGRDVLLAVVRGDKLDGLDTEKEDERAAVELCGVIGLREAIPALERRAFGLSKWVKDTSAFFAKIALARMGHERAIREILADLDASRKAAREAAVVAVGRARIEAGRAALERLTKASVDPALVAEALGRLG